MNSYRSGLLLLIMTLLLTPQSKAAFRCIDILNQNSAVVAIAKDQQVAREVENQDKALVRIDIQHFYERVINFLQKHVTVSSVRSSLAQQRSRKLNLIHFLKEGKSNEAIDIYRRKFDNVELSYWVIKNSEKQISQLSAQSSLRGKLQRRRMRHQFMFAQSYGEYIEIRSYLENVISQTPTTTLLSSTAEKTLRYLGAHKFSKVHPDYADLKIPEKRIELKEVKELFRSSARYTRIKLWADFKSEILSTFRYFLSSEVLVGAADSALNRLPIATSDKIKNFIGLMRSAQLRQRTLPMLVEIESLPDNPKLRYDELREKNTLTNKDELLVTYARTVEFTEGFNRIKEVAKELAAKPDNIIHRAFYERLLSAELRAAQLPDISLYEKMSNIDVMFTVIQAGIILKVTSPQVFNSATEFINFLVGVPFFS